MSIGPLRRSKKMVPKGPAAEPHPKMRSPTFAGTSSGSFMHSSIPERRVEPRSRIQNPILVFAGDPVVEAEAITRDVSRRGVFFYTELPVTIGQVVEFRILVPGQGATSARALCNGMVIRVERGSSDAVQAPGVALQINSIQLY